MALAPLNIFVETQTRRLKSSATNTQDFVLPYMVQGEKKLVYLTFLEPSVPFVVTAPYTKLNASGYSAAITICAGDPTGTAGTPVIVAMASGVDWTWDATNSRFTGSLDLTAAALTTAIGSAKELACTFEIELLDSSGNREKYIQQALTIKASVKEAATVAPDPSNTYLTANEQYALFARYVNEAGKTITFRSADSTATREIGVDNDAVPIDNASDS